MDTKQRLDIYDEAFNALTDMDNFAQGGRAGYRFGIGPLLELLSKTSPKQAGQKYLKSVKDRAQKGDMKSLSTRTWCTFSNWYICQQTYERRFRKYEKSRHGKYFRKLYKRIGCRSFL